MRFVFLLFVMHINSSVKINCSRMTTMKYLGMSSNKVIINLTMIFI